MSDKREWLTILNGKHYFITYDLSRHLSVVFGSWYEHVSGWWEKKQISSNILYLFYEDLIEVSVEVTLYEIMDIST